MTYTGSIFKHEPLDWSAQQIRLLSILPKAKGPIQCTLGHFDLSATPTPNYKALSYRWGPPSPVQGIEVNGKLFTVRQNLYDFLHTFRARLFKFSGSGQYEEEIQWIWIDQICIDQSLTEERNHQVQMMSKIYVKASYVYVWLGSSDHHTEMVMKALKVELRRYYNRTISPAKPNANDVQLHQQSAAGLLQPNKDNNDTTDLEAKPMPISTESWNRFFRNPYWRRLLIVQEIMLARYIRLMCGETLLSWDELRRFCSFGIKRYTEEVMQVVPPQVVWLTKHALSARTYNLTSLLRTFCTSECYDTRDKVYGLQGLLDKNARVEIDYEKTHQMVFRDAVISIVNEANDNSSTLLRSAEDLPGVEAENGAHLKIIKSHEYQNPLATDLIIKGIEELDSKKPAQEVFADAAMVMKREADDMTHLPMLHILIDLSEEMGVGIPIDKLDGNLTEKIAKRFASVVCLDFNVRSFWESEGEPI